MRVLQELLSSFLPEEGEVESRQLADVWAEHEDQVKIYVPRAIFQVRPAEDETGIRRYEIYAETPRGRELVGQLDSSDFERAYTPVRPTQKPDAEGFTLYREDDEVEAFEYDGQTIKVTLDSRRLVLRRGMYVVRREDDGAFSYSVQPKKRFESDFTEQK